MVISQSDIIGHALKMVVALRREFSRNIDVMAVAKDQDYARSVIDLAAGSSSERLREQARYLERMLWGPRESVAPDAPVSDAPEPAGFAGQQQQAGAAQGETEETIAAQHAKYVRGLR